MKTLAISTIILLLNLFLFNCAPKTSEQYCKRASSYRLRSKDINMSDSLLKIAVKLDSNNHLAYCLLGENVSWDTSKMELKRKYYLKAIFIDSTKTNYYVFYGQTYHWQAIERNEDRSVKSINYTYLNKAIDIFSKGISIDSTNNNLYSQRAYCYSIIGNTILAEQDMFNAARHGDKQMQKRIKREYPNKASR